MTDDLVARLRRRSRRYIAEEDGIASVTDDDCPAAADRIERLEDALGRIEQWSQAYPLDIFPEPDFAKAHELLKAGGMTLDSISASCMRHVVEGVGKIASDALAEATETTNPSSGDGAIDGERK